MEDFFPLGRQSEIPLGDGGVFIGAAFFILPFALLFMRVSSIYHLILYKKRNQEVDNDSI
jgi:hypothetical protein